MDILREHVDILGRQVRDRVTGFEGVAASVSFDLYGCVQVVVTPKAKDGETKSGVWLDIQRLEITDPTRVMPVPSFELLATRPEPASPPVHTHGPAEKPAR